MYKFTFLQSLNSMGIQSSSLQLYWLIHCTFFSLRWSNGNFEIIAMNAMNLRWKKDFFQVENLLKIEILKKITKKVFFFLKSRFFWTKNCEKIQKIAKIRLKLIMRWIFPLHCDEFSLQRFFSLRWIHCLLAGVIRKHPILGQISSWYYSDLLAQGII